MGINLLAPSTTTTSVLIADTYQAPGGSNDSIPSLTKVGGVPIAAALEIQSTQGAFVPPRMTGVQAAALAPISQGMQVYVIGGHNAPFNADGLYIRGAAGWNLVANSGNFGNVTVSNTDPEPQFVVPVWSGTTNEIMSTTVSIENSNQLLGISYVQGVMNPPNNFPLYGMNPSNTFVSTEGIGTTGVGRMTLSAGGGIQADVTGTSNTSNFLTFSGGTSGNPASIATSGSDANISLKLNPKGFGTVHNNVGSSSLPAYSFTGRTGDGMYSVSNGTLGFSAQGLRQVEIFGTGDGSNFLVFSGSATGQPAQISSTGSDTDVSLAIGTKGAGQILADSDGSETNPIYSFRANPGNGMFRFDRGPNSVLGFSAEGAMQLVVPPSGDGTNVIVSGGSSTGQPPFILASGTDTDVSLMLAVQGNGIFAFTSTTQDNGLFISGSTTGNPVVISSVGSDTNVNLELKAQGSGQIISTNSGTGDFPAYSFSSDTGSGVYSPTANVLGFATGSALQAQVFTFGDGTNYLEFGGGDSGMAPVILAQGSDADVSLNLAVRGIGQIIANSDGSSSAPMYSFKNHTGIGIYTDGTNLGISTDAVQASVTSVGFSIPVSINGTVYYLKASALP